MKREVMSRMWAMPSPDTFSIEPIAALLDRWLPKPPSVILDPFARNSNRGTHTNDLNPETTAASHMDAVDWLESLNVQADALLFDPPYSPRQITECYSSVGRAVGMKETQSAVLYRSVKDSADRLLKVGAVAICFGWNSMGMGMGGAWRMDEILLVPHGGAHNDTIVTVEVKLQGGLFGSVLI